MWDYPRPPALVRSIRHVVVRSPGAAAVLADSTAALRVLETSHPPTWYVPPADVALGVLRRSRARSTVCEWKGAATYWDVVTPDAVLEAAAWSYEEPTPTFTDLASFLAFGPARLECSVDGERARPQEGGFYAGWITNDVVGPFKGVPGSWGW